MNEEDQLGQVESEREKKRNLALHDDVELFQQDFKINQWAHQSHLVYRVYVPENIRLLHVQFNYGPIVETNKESITKAVLREGLSESLIQEDTTVRNLLNSLDQ